MRDKSPMNRFDRRRVIKALSAAGFAGMAGCIAEDDEELDPDEEGSGSNDSEGENTDNESDNGNEDSEDLVDEDVRDEDATEITFWEYFGGTEQDEIVSLVNEFNDEHEGEIFVNMSTVPFDEFFDAIFTSIASEDAPHVATYWMSFSNYMVDQGAIDPIDEYMDVSVDDYYESAHPAMQVDGDVYALPMDIHGNMLLSNDTVLEEAGVDEIPDDWESFQAACEDVGENTDARPFALMDNDSPVVGMRHYFNVLVQEGGRLVEQTDDGWEVLYDQSDEGIAAAEFIDDVTGTYEWDSTDLADDEERWNLFRDDELAFLLAGNWTVNQLQDDEGEIPEDLEFTYSKPYVFPGGEPATFGESTGYFFPSDPSHTQEEREAAVQFTEWITHNNPLWAQTAGHLPAAREVGESEEVQTAEYYEELGIVSTLAEMAEAGEMIYHPRLPVDLYETAIASPLVDIYAQNAEPQEAIESSAETLRDRLS